MNTIELAKECGTEPYFKASGLSVEHTIEFSETQLEAFAEKIRADERERCAKVCDTIERSLSEDVGKHGAAVFGAIDCAEAIRNMTAGGEHE